MWYYRKYGLFFPTPTPGNPIAEGDTMMAYHKRIDATNQALLKRVDDLENQCVNPANGQANVTADPLTPTLPVRTNCTQLIWQHHSSLASSSSSQVGTSQSVYTSLGLPGPAAQLTQSSHLYNAVIPDPSMQFPLFYNQCLTFCQQWRPVPGQRLHKVRPHFKNMIWNIFMGLVAIRTPCLMT